MLVNRCALNRALWSRKPSLLCEAVFVKRMEISGNLNHQYVLEEDYDENYEPTEEGK